MTVGLNLVFLNNYDDGLGFTEAEHRVWLTEATVDAMGTLFQIHLQRQSIERWPRRTCVRLP
jgi:hypothetical protein